MVCCVACQSVREYVLLWVHGVTTATTATATTATTTTVSVSTATSGTHHWLMILKMLWWFVMGCDGCLRVIFCGPVVPRHPDPTKPRIKKRKSQWQEAGGSRLHELMEPQAEISAAFHMPREANIGHQYCNVISAIAMLNIL